MNQDQNKEIAVPISKKNIEPLQWYKVSDGKRIIGNKAAAPISELHEKINEIITYLNNS